MAMSTRGSFRKAALLSVLGLATLVVPLYAEAPLTVAKARDIRSRIVSDAESYLGVPYEYGGISTKGIDCSGLVYRVFKDVLGLGVPRTTKTLYDFSERVNRERLEPGDLVFFNTTGPLAHVGIYAGDDIFINAASEGQRTGVIKSSLDDPYWAEAYAGGGRLITPAGYLGLLLGLGGGPLFGADNLGRGFGLSANLVYPIWGVEPGIQVAPSWDVSLGVFRLPFQLSFGIDRHLRFYAGPVFTLGQPRLSVSSGTRSYTAEGGVLGSAGIAWAPFEFKLGQDDWRLVGTLDWNRYVAAAGQPTDTQSDLAASLRFGLYLESRILI